MEYLKRRLEEIFSVAEKELIPDQILKIIVDGFVIRECDIEIIKQEVWNESTDSRWQTDPVGK